MTVTITSRLTSNNNKRHIWSHFNSCSGVDRGSFDFFFVYVPYTRIIL